MSFLLKPASFMKISLRLLCNIRPLSCGARCDRHFGRSCSGLGYLEAVSTNGGLGSSSLNRSSLAFLGSDGGLENP